MARRNLLDQVERDALDERSDLPSLLRRCIALGGETGSAGLIDWATRELKGYGNEDDLPSYRTGSAPLLVDGIAGFNQISGQFLPASSIPDFAQGDVSDELEFRQPIAELIRLAESNDRHVMMMPPGAGLLIQYMNHEIVEEESKQFGWNGQPTRRVERLYWSVSPTTIARVADVVRTTLVELVAEMKASMPRGEEVPSREAADQAVNVAIHGGKRNRVVVAQAGESAGAAGTGQPQYSDSDSPVRRWVYVTAAVVAAGAAVVALFVR